MPQHNSSSLTYVIQRLLNEINIEDSNEIFAWNDASEGVTWSEFANQVREWYGFWSSKSETKWALYFKDTYTFLAALLGAWLAGKCIVLPGDTLPRTVEFLRPEVAGFVGEFERAETLRSTQSIEVESVFAVNFELLAKAQTVFLTSGSTGLPKKIVKSIEQLILETSALTEAFKLSSDNVTLATVSHQHFYGFIFRALLPLLEQRPITTFTPQFQEDLIRFAENHPHKIILISSPAFLNRLTERDDWAAFTDKINTVFSAGGVLNDAQHKLIKQLWTIDPHEIYGSTEHGVTAYRHFGETSGYFTALAAIDIKQTEEGVLALRSSYMDQTDLCDGWAITADKVTLLEPLTLKSFELCGRSDRIIKIEEKRISLTQMESSLMTHPLISKAHVIPIQSGNESKRVILGAAIVLNEQGLQLLAEHGRASLSALLKSHIQEGFERLSTPRRWRFLSESPVNAQGKVEFQVLNEILNSTAEVLMPVSVCMQRDPETVTLKLQMPIDLLYFKGHFTEQPIVPGVVLLEWVAEFTKQYFGVSDQFKEIKKLKFHQIIQPKDVVFLELTFLATKNEVGFAVYQNELKQQIIASGAMVWTNAEQNHE